MILDEMMNCKNFVVVGKTTDEEKFACKIKNILLKNNYKVYSIPYETKTFDEVLFDNFIIDLCINPIKGLEILKSCNKRVFGVIIQPGAESDDIISYLKDSSIPYVLGCAYKYLENK